MATSTDNFNPKLKIAYRILVQVAISDLDQYIVKLKTYLKAT